LYQEILNIRPGENKIVSMTKDNNAFKTLMAATAFQTDGRIYKLIAFQDVNEALDETEAKAWQKLLSVMTHEIMNSVAPISSLAETMLHTGCRHLPVCWKGSPAPWRTWNWGLERSGAGARGC